MEKKKRRTDDTQPSNETLICPLSMAWASLHFSIRLISCCKKWNRAHNTPYVWISSIHSHTVKFLLLQACAFLCNFLRLHKHEACWLWDNENVSRFPPTEEKAKADTSLLNSSPSREFSSTCWDANCGCVFCFVFLQTIILIGNWQTCLEGDTEEESIELQK